MRDPPETDGGSIGNAEPVLKRRRPVSSAMALGTDGRRGPRGRRGRHIKKEQAVKARNQSRAVERNSSAKASRISGRAVKSRCAGEWGGWGRLSDDGLGQHNPDRSEGPWGRATIVVQTVVRWRTAPPTLSGDSVVESGTYEGQWQTEVAPWRVVGKAVSDIPALKPYWGKPAVRNFREGDGNVGFVSSRSIRAIVLPD